MPHILHDRARAWYQNVYKQIYTWSDFVRLIKSKFLPLDYHFSLLVELEQRYQRRNETVGAYINDMELRFRALPEPLHERHQVNIIRRNLLTDYALQLANLEIGSVRELEQACKRIESAKLLLASRSRRDKDRYDVSTRSRRELACIETTENSSEFEVEVEIAAIHTKPKSKQRSASQPPGERTMMRQMKRNAHLAKQIMNS